MLGSLRKWSHSSHNIWFLNNKPRPVSYFWVTFCSILAQARLGQQIVSPKRHDVSHACIFSSLCIAMATIVLIMESQNSKLYIRWGSVFPVDRTLISHWRKALYLGFPSSFGFHSLLQQPACCVQHVNLEGLQPAGGQWHWGRWSDPPVSGAAWHCAGLDV